MFPVDIEIAGRNAETFPSLHVWGWEIALYLFLGGLAAGLLVLSGWMHRRSQPEGLSPALAWIAPLLAPAVLSVGMFALFLDLENKWHVWRFYTTFRITAPMSWGAWILALVYPASALFAWAAWSEFGPAGSRFVSGAPFPFRRAIASLNIALGAALGVYTGILLGALGARPLWNSPLLGPLFLLSGLSAAAALLLILEKDHAWRRTLARLDVRLIAAEAVVLALFFLALSTGGQAQRAAAGLFFGGPYTAVFWLAVAFMGMALPVWLERLEQRDRIPHSAVPAVLVLIGGLALRAVLVLAGQASSWEVLL
ncbi:MAG: NrfD/PsrC family molybdoenzyme membrane anchor subunit [Bryobacteraceae bacterium]